MSIEDGATENEPMKRQGGIGPIPETIIFHVAKQLANALCYLHKQKILHCSLKSKSVLVSSVQGSSILENMHRSTIPGPDGTTPLANLIFHDWRVKIADFTLAKHASAHGKALNDL